MTHYHYTPFVIPLVVTALFGAVMLVVAWRNRAEPVALWFAATVAALLVWTIGYAFELMAVGLHAKIVWADLEYAAMLALPLFWLQVVMVYTRRRGLSRAVWVALGAAAGALYLGIVVNPYRSFRGHPQVVTHGALSALHPDYGPLWRFGGMPFEYVILLVAALLLVRNTMHAHSIHVRQSLALAVASILPLAGGTAYIVARLAVARLQLGHGGAQRLRPADGLRPVLVPALRPGAAGARRGDRAPGRRGHGARRARAPARLQPGRRALVP